MALHGLREHAAPLHRDLGNLRLNVKFRQVIWGRKRTALEFRNPFYVVLWFNPQVFIFLFASSDQPASAEGLALI